MSSAVKSVKKFVKDPKRMVSALATGGLSEQFRSGGKLISKLSGEKEAGQGGVQLNKSPFDLSQEAQVAFDQSNQQLTNALGQQKALTTASAPALQQLALTAQGKGPSLANAQLKAAQDRNLAQLVAQQSANRGQGGGSAARNLAVASTAGNRNVAQDSAQARIQEINQARTQLLDEKANADLAAKSGIDTSYQYSIAPSTALQDYEKTKAGIASQMAQIDATKYAARKAGQAQMLGSLFGGAGAAIASDKKLKKDVKSESEKMEKFLSAIKAKSFEYKNENALGASPGDKFGVMAQDLEKSEVGKTLVKDTPNGKMVDVNQTVMAVLAAQSDLNKRLKSMEKKKK